MLFAAQNCAKCGGGCGIRTHVPRGQTVFKSVSSRYLCVSFQFTLFDFDFQKANLHHGFPLQSHPFELKMTQFETKWKIWLLAKIFPFCENSARTSNPNVWNVSSWHFWKNHQNSQNTIEQKNFLRNFQSGKSLTTQGFFNSYISCSNPARGNSRKQKHREGL